MPPIKLPHGNTTFESNVLKEIVRNSGREYIIQGQQACTLNGHTKPSSLDYWLRGLVDNPDTKQGVNEVIDQLLTTGDFEEGKFLCPDSGRMCKGIKVT